MQTKHRATDKSDRKATYLQELRLKDENFPAALCRWWDTISHYRNGDFSFGDSRIV
jgi:hypothetical protein